MRDLRNGSVVRNVTRKSARKLWHYAITQYEQHPAEKADIKWLGDLGLLGASKRAGAQRYDFVQRLPDGKLRTYYGVTEDGIHGEWQKVAELAPAASPDGPAEAAGRRGRLDRESNTGLSERAVNLLKRNGHEEAPAVDPATAKAINHLIEMPRAEFEQLVADLYCALGTRRQAHRRAGRSRLRYRDRDEVGAALDRAVQAVARRGGRVGRARVLRGDGARACGAGRDHHHGALHAQSGAVGAGQADSPLRRPGVLAGLAAHQGTLWCWTRMNADGTRICNALDVHRGDGAPARFVWR